MPTELQVTNFARSANQWSAAECLQHESAATSDSDSPSGGPTVADGQTMELSDSIAVFSLTVLVVQTNVAQRNVCNTKGAAIPEY
ncbi:MAG: hypothetical protein ACI30A_02270 [Paludibacteraceae bacterium]